MDRQALSTNASPARVINRQATRPGVMVNRNLFDEMDALSAKVTQLGAYLNQVQTQLHASNISRTVQYSALVERVENPLRCFVCFGQPQQRLSCGHLMCNGCIAQIGAQFSGLCQNNTTSPPRPLRTLKSACHNRENS